MKYSYLFHVTTFFLVISCGPQGQGDSPTISAADVETLRNIKMELWAKAYEEQDTTLLGQLLHDKYQLIDDTGEVYSKNDEMTYVSQYGPTYESFVYEIDQIEVFPNGTAVVTGRGAMRGTDDEGNYLTTYKESNSFVKEGDAWRAINTHVSGVKDIREVQ